MNNNQITIIEKFIEDVNKDIEMLKKATKPNEGDIKFDICKVKNWAFIENLCKHFADNGLSFIIDPSDCGYVRIGEYNDEEYNKFKEFLSEK